MLDRRKYKRFETEINAKMSTIGFVANTDAACLISDASKGGAKIIAPVFFQNGQDITIEIEILGGPIIIEGAVVDCREDFTAKKRFDKTYAVHVKFSKELSENDWKSILALK